VPAQQHAHQASAPGGVLTAQLQGLLDQGAELGRVGVGLAGIRRDEGVLALHAQTLQQLTHGAGDEAQAARDQAGALPLFSPLDNHQTHGHRNRMWHEQSSLKKSVPP